VESVRERRAGLNEWDEERLVLDSMVPRENNPRAAVDYLANVIAVEQHRCTRWRRIIQSGHPSGALLPKAAHTGFDSRLRHRQPAPGR